MLLLSPDLNRRPVWITGLTKLTEEQQRMIMHLVMMKLKPTVSAAEIDTLFGKFQAMVPTMQGLESFNGGPYSSPEGINRGYTHGFSMVFSSAAARNAYLPSDEHVEVASGLGDMLDGSFEEAVVAFDYEY